MEHTLGRRAGRGLAPTSSGLRLVGARSIDELDTRSWDACFGGGLCQSQALRVLERSFGTERSAEHQWRFFYYEVWEQERCVLRTFFTSALCKEDLLAPASVSRLAEARRERDPGFLVSRLFLMGSLLSESRHLWCDPRADAAGAIALLLDAVQQQARDEHAATIVLGQFAEEADALAPLFRELGFHATPFPEAYDLTNFGDRAAWFAALSPKSRRHLRKEVLPYAEHFVGAARPAATTDASELREAYELHLRLKKRSFEVNDFPLPEQLWHDAARPGSGFDLLTLRRPGAAGEMLAAGLGFPSRGVYTPIVLGLIGGPLEEPGLYRTSLIPVLDRARELGCQEIRFGPGAGLEKRRLGARPVPLRIFASFLQPERLQALAALMREAEAASPQSA